MSSVDFPPEVRQTFTPGGTTGTGTVTLSVPDPYAWQIVAVTFRVVTSAVAGTRTPTLTILGGDQVAVAIAAAGYGITASSTADYSYCYGLSEWDQANSAAASGPTPAIPLLPGDTLSLALANADTGDAISRVHVSLAIRNSFS